MNNITIYHNPKCSKSRDGVKILEESGLDFKVIKYLDEPLSISEIKNILHMLNIGARELMRVKEDIYRDLGLKEVSDEDLLVEAMASNPRLIERPIVVMGNKAVIGRPAENISDLIK